MLSASAEYTGQSSAKNTQTDWLLELAYDDTTPGTFYFSGADREITNFYHGNVIDWGVIDESIDVTKSSASIADIEIVLANSYANATGLLSAELFGGSKKFINQDVTIKSWLPGLSLANCLTIYKGRLVDIRHDLETVTLSIEKRSPWDRVKFPNVFSTNKKILFPSAYGDFTRNASTVASKDFVTSQSLWPMPVNDIAGLQLVSLLHNKAGITQENAHFYEPSLDIFVPLDPVNTTEITYQGGKAIGAPITLKRGFDYRPTILNSSDPGDFTDPEKAFNGNTSDCAIVTFDGTGTVTSGFDLIIDVPSIDGNITDIDIAVKYDITLDAGTGLNSNVEIWDASYGASAPELEIINTNTSVGTTVSGAETIHSVSGYTTTTWYNSDRYQADNTLPSTINLQAIFANIIPGDSINGECKIYDVILRIASELDFSTEESAGYDKIHKIDELYTGADGFNTDWTGGGGVASYPHDIYRDILYRYTGWDATGIDYVEVNGVDWSSSDIDTDRNWACRWWTLEQKPLYPTLDQLMFEGGFIWVFDETSSGREARVIYVEFNDATSGTLTVGKKYIITDFQTGDNFTNVGAASNATGVEFVATGTTPTTWSNGSTLRGTYSDSDIDIDYNDITNLSISTTPFSEIVTKRTFNFQRHPADERRYIQTNSLTNANRGNYNLEAEENAIEQNLDFLTDSDDADDLLDYYDNIVGEPKIIVQCDLLNPKDWVLQVGDIVKFENMAYDPYGKDFDTPIYFMCTRTNISPNKFTANFREVG